MTKAFIQVLTICGLIIGILSFNVSAQEEIAADEVLSKHGYGIDLRLGYQLFYRDLSNEFTNQVLFGVEFAYLRDERFYSFGIDIGTGKIKRDRRLTLDYTWEKDEKAEYVSAELVFGKRYPFNKRGTIAPFFSLGFSFMGESYGAREEKGVEDDSKISKGLGSSFSPGFGALYDFRLKTTTRSGSFFGKSYKEQGSWFLRIKSGFRFLNFNDVEPSAGGGMLYLSVGITGIGRKVKKK